MIAGLPWASMGWLAAALIVGLVIAVLPLTAALALIGGAALVGVALIHPAALLVVLLVFAPMRTLIATEFPVVFGSGWPLPLDIGQILAIAFLGAWALHKLVRWRLHPSAVRLGWSPLLTPLLLFAAITALTAFNAASLGGWLTEWLKWLQMLLIAYAVFDLGQTLGWRWFIFSLVTAALTNALIGIYQYFGGSGALHLLISPTADNFRAFGTFGQPNPFGGFMGLIAPLAITAALGCGWHIWREWRAVGRLRTAAMLGLIYYAVSACIISAALIMSWSRGAWLGFGVSLAVIALALPRKAVVSLALAGAALLALGGLYASGRLPASIAARLSTITEDIFSVRDVRGVDINPENYAVIERLAHWQAAVDMATAHPWLGVGLGGYEIAYAEYRLINWKFPLGHAHNYYLNVLAETGIIGLAAYVVFVTSLVWSSWRARQHPDPSARLIAIGSLATWAYVSVHSLTDNLYVNNVFIHLSVTIGIVCLLNRDIPHRTPTRRQESRP
jgi:O-antigen ligase